MDSDEERMISVHGWAIRGIEECFEGGMPIYAHTVGLHQRGLSELIVVGLPLASAPLLIAELGDRYFCVDANFLRT